MTSPAHTHGQVPGAADTRWRRVVVPVVECDLRQLTIRWFRHQSKAKNITCVATATGRPMLGSHNVMPTEA